MGCTIGHRAPPQWYQVGYGQNQKIHQEYIFLTFFFFPVLWSSFWCLLSCLLFGYGLLLKQGGNCMIDSWAPAERRPAAQNLATNDITSTRWQKGASKTPLQNQKFVSLSNIAQSAFLRQFSRLLILTDAGLSVLIQTETPAAETLKGACTVLARVITTTISSQTLVYI